MRGGYDVIYPALKDAVEEIALERGNINPRILGRWIEKKQGDRLDGRWFERLGERSGNRLWRLCCEAGVTRPEIAAEAETF